MEYFHWPARLSVRLCSRSAPAHLLVSWTWETGKSPGFHSNNWEHQCYQHSCTKCRTQQLLGGKLTLSQPKPGQSPRGTPKVVSHLQYCHWVGWMVFWGTLAPSCQDWVLQYGKWKSVTGWRLYLNPAGKCVFILNSPSLKAKGMDFQRWCCLAALIFGKGGPCKAGC